MTTATISISVDEETAKAYAAASTEEQCMMELLLRLRLQDLTLSSHRPLKAVMDDIGKQVEARGTTPEVLETLRHDE